MFLILLGFWLILNGRITTEIVLVGLVVCGVLTWAWQKLFAVKTRRILLTPGAAWGYLCYFGGLIIEIIRCNFQVMRLILHPGEEVRPQLVTFRIKLRRDTHKVMLANAITLTPGTITVGLQDDLIRVHGLDASFLEGIESCDLVTKLEKMEEKHV